ncbi:MAG: DUF4466 family protein [Dysgonamonadaceae bacterium]|jgi:hypothetical protein|nr:DUF4466 family protein [Dysgonamonadaceae bacterium]
MKLFKYLLLLSIPVGLFVSCSDDDDNSGMKNDFIKKTTSPAIVGESIEFAYAMGATNGRLNTAEATASIAGGAGTGFGLFSYFTARGNLTVNDVRYIAGDDVPLKTVKEATTNGAVSTATMMEQVDANYINPTVAFGTSQTDLVAATIRYYYVVPEEARGKEFSVKFSSKSTTGEIATYQTPGYKVSKMDMKRSIQMTGDNVCYFSIADMRAYTKAEVESQNISAKIDFVYLYQAKLGAYDYGSAFVSPATDPMYIAIADIIPGNWTKNNTQMEKRVDVKDAQLKGSMPNVYIDDIDFETLDLSAAVNYIIGFSADHGAFMETADGKYAAYIYVNSVSNGTMTVSIKRYPLK